MQHLETLKDEVRSMLADEDHSPFSWRRHHLFNQRLNSANLKGLGEATITHTVFLETLVVDLHRLDQQR